jgi:hypothetical protein
MVINGTVKSVRYKGGQSKPTTEQTLLSSWVQLDRIYRFCSKVYGRKTWLAVSGRLCDGFYMLPARKLVTSARIRGEMAQRFTKAVRTASDTMMSRARVYADVNVNRPKDYWDYENLTITWG